MLLALTSVERFQTLGALDTENMKKTEQYYLFGIEEHAKQNCLSGTCSLVSWSETMITIICALIKR